MTTSMVCCPLSDHDGDLPDFYDQRVVTCRKPTKCTECGEDIARGIKYERCTGKWDGGRIDTYKTCLSCVEIRDHFAKGCGGRWVFTMLWEDLAENFFPTMTAGGPCMEGLSPAAKQRLFDRRMKWYEETNE